MTFSVIDIKYPPSFLFKPSISYCWLFGIIFILSAFIDPLNYPRVQFQSFSGIHPTRTYGFASPTGLWKIVARVTVFVISPLSINTLIGFKSVTQVIQVWSCPIGAIPLNYLLSDQNIFNKIHLYFVFYVLIIVLVDNKIFGPSYTNAYWVYPLNFVCFIFIAKKILGIAKSNVLA